MIKSGLICITLLGFSGAAVGSDIGLYFGVKVGNVVPKIEGYNLSTNQTYNFEPVTSIGGVIGYIIDQNLILEGEINNNIDSGEISSFGNDKLNKWNITTLSVYGLYKGNGKTHLRLKAGLTSASVKYPDNLSANTWAPEGSSTKLSYGIGVGFDTSSGKEFIVEWTQLAENISQISVGIYF